MKTTYSRVALIEIKTIKDYVTEKRTRLWRKRAKRSASSKTKCNKRVSLSEQMYDTANQHIYDMLSGGKSLAKQQITERMAEKGLPSDTVFMNLFWRMPNVRHSFAAALKWETHIPTCS